MVREVKMRSLLIGGLFTLLFVVLIGRLYYIQVIGIEVGEKKLIEHAELKWEEEKNIPAVRGTILDRKDKVLAEDAPAYTVELQPQILKDNGNGEEVVRTLAEILAEPAGDPVSTAALADRIRTSINKPRVDTKTGETVLYGQVELGKEGWKLDTEKSDKIFAFIEEQKLLLKARSKDNKAGPVGITMRAERKRFYPSGNLAAHLLGYNSKEGAAMMGLEYQLDKELKGIDGKLNFQSDRYGTELPDSENRYQPVVNGSNVRLTIDKNIQHYVEQALKKVEDTWHPKSLTAIAVDPNTMEILAMANTPTFNPNKYWDAQDAFMNHAVASQYEPGSTFKLVTLAAAVEEGVFNPNDTYQSGSIKVPGNTLHDHNYVGWGRISYLDGLKRSSNVAFVKLGTEKLGNEKFRDYIMKFGFGAKTGIDVSGELSGIVRMKEPVEYATATYGQGPLTVTAIQQVAAYAAIANGGKLMKPYLIKEIYDPATGAVVKKTEPEVVREVVSEKTAKQVTEYLEQVVSDKQKGTGTRAAVEGYRVAGKTGTANKVLPGELKYADDRWVISFIGYAPAEDPKILVAVIADEPDLGGDYHEGGKVAAPAFAEIVSHSLRYMGIAPTTEQSAAVVEKDTSAQVPDLSGKTVEEAQALMEPFGVVVETVGRGSQILAQSPAAGTEIGGAERIYVVLQTDGEFAVPDFTGKSLRDAMEVCSFLKLKCTSTGEGYVAGQSLEVSGDSRVLTLQLVPYNQLMAMQEAGKNAAKGKANAASSKTTDSKNKTGSSASGSGTAKESNSSAQSTSKKPADSTP